MSDENEKVEQSEQETTALAVKNNDGMVVTDSDIPIDLADLDDDEELRVVPLMKICQAMSADANENNVKQGNIYSVLDYSNHEKLEVVLCHHWKSRVLHGEAGQRNKCWSNDGMVADAPNSVNRTCSDCPENIIPLEERTQTGGKYGDCNSMLNLIMFAPNGEFFGVAQMGFEKTAFVTVKKLLGGIKYARKNKWADVYELSVVHKQDGKGPYFAPVFKRLRATSEEEREKAVEIFYQFKKGDLKANEAGTISDESTEAKSDLPF